MSTSPNVIGRRTVLKSAVLALGATWDASSLSAAAPPTGKAGDFAFLSGEWRIHHRRLRSGQWDEFDGEATVHGLLAGVASVEELRIPARDFSGIGVRLLDVKGGRWADYWVNGRDGVLTPPPLWGGFAGGAGIFSAEETEDGKTTIYRGIWDRIAARSCRWQQSSSVDGGATWAVDWSMDWVRA